ncbi:General stress protein 69 [Pelotomaculum schinkii]|uniref:General stress protein 69 n=1 Tax=Pelotomaculum schinkii TaxID=78350 RepID=A0A4Y7RC66_9FIRM|nr:aldo/keto reductase [Pelotomaculum schinkii]TEB06574.1 General stress protein 69 [Pelotomaculum schinkii]
MQYRYLARTGMRVSRLCFGALTIGPLQANLPLVEGARIIRTALEAGVNFIDTAELYRTYSYIREAIRGYQGEVIIASKCYAYTSQGMQDSLELALRELKRDYIDIFMLHEQESILTIRGHWEAIEYLSQAKKKGLVRAIGISTHHVEGVLGAASVPEIEIIQPLVNLSGIGIKGGNIQDMLAAIHNAAEAGKGLYGMKALGGGNLLERPEEAFAFILSIPEFASVAVGMSTEEEVAYNTCLFSGKAVPEEVKAKVRRQPRRLHIEEYCCGCGECLAKCSSGALRLNEGKAVVDHQLCTRCGYCSPVCPDFCIKVI